MVPVFSGLLTHPVTTDKGPKFDVAFLKYPHYHRISNMTSIYQTMYVDERVSLSPSEMNLVTDAASIQSILETKLRESHEGKCNANGFVRPGSLKLLARSMGAAENGRFTGNLIFDCKLSCEILYPTAGYVLKARVIKVNRMGAYAIFDDAIRILLPRDLHIGVDAFDKIQEGNTISVVIDRSRFQTNDPFIMAVGRMEDVSATIEETEESEEEEES